MITCLLATALAACGASDATPIPELDAPGVHAELARLRGKPVLLNLWAMWCAPCVKELPDFEVVAQEIRAEGGEAVALCVEQTGGAALEKTRERLPRFVQRRNLSFPVWLFGPSKDAELWQGFELPRARQSGGIPVTLAINRDGRVVDFVEGAASRDRMRALMAAALR